MANAAIGIIELTVEQVIAWLAAHPELIADIESFIHGKPTAEQEVDAARSAGEAAVDVYEAAKVK